jgi:ZIP family zinc transporter
MGAQGATEQTRLTKSPMSMRQVVLTAVVGILPLVLLALLVLLFSALGERLTGSSGVPADALGRLDIERLSFESSGIVASIVNSGPSEIRISQVAVNDALWDFTTEPGEVLPRLGRTKVKIPFPWLEGDPYTVTLIASNGLKFEATAPVAVKATSHDASQLGAFALLGVYAGGIPVYLGLLWWPFVRRLSEHAMAFLVSLTGGVLLFLGVNLLFEAIELAGQVPRPYQGIGLLTIGLALGVGVLVLLNRSPPRAAGPGDAVRSRLTLAYSIALGIGLHNFGEGLVIGAAYLVGEVALGALLVVGFLIHNTTEGLAIVSPIARDRRRIWHLVALGGIAGLPTILGTVLGASVYSTALATLFMALGAGAIFFVIAQLARLMLHSSESRIQTSVGVLSNVTGLLTGLLLMYGTALFVSV